PSRSLLAPTARRSPSSSSARRAQFSRSASILWKPRRSDGSRSFSSRSRPIPTASNTRRSSTDDFLLSFGTPTHEHIHSAILDLLEAQALIERPRRVEDLHVNRHRDTLRLRFG